LGATDVFVSLATLDAWWVGPRVGVVPRFSTPLARAVVAADGGDSRDGGTELLDRRGGA
jgi:hypothetical protein